MNWIDLLLGCWINWSWFDWWRWSFELRLIWMMASSAAAAAAAAAEPKEKKKSKQRSKCFNSFQFDMNWFISDLLIVCCQGEKAGSAIAVKKMILRRPKDEERLQNIRIQENPTSVTPPEDRSLYTPLEDATAAGLPTPRRCSEAMAHHIRSVCKDFIRWISSVWSVLILNKSWGT